MLTYFSMGMSFNDIVFTFIQIFASSFFSLLVYYLISKKDKTEVSAVELYLVSSLLTLLTVICRFYFPVAVLVAAVVLAFFILKVKISSQHADALIWFVALGGAVGFGSGYVILTSLFFVVIVFPAIILKKKKN